MELTILRPVPWTLVTEGTGEERGETTVWTPSGLMSGYASWGGADAKLPTGEYRAELCMLSWLLRYTSRLSQIPHRRLFAPSFVPEYASSQNYRHDGPHGWLNENRTRIKPGTHFTLPWWDIQTEHSFPRRERRLQHNAVLALSERKYRQWRKNMIATLDESQHIWERWDGGMFTRPYMWASCTQVASWLRELVRSQLVDESRVQEVLREDRTALAVVSARQSYLSHLGKAGYRVLFTYEGARSMEFTPFL